MARTISIPSLDAHQDRLLARADEVADTAERAVLRVWLDLLRAIRTGGSWPVVFTSTRHALHSLPAVARTIGQDLADAHRQSSVWTAEKLAATLPRRHRLTLLRRRGLLEDATEQTDLLAGILLPPIDAAAVQRVVYGSGWLQQITKLTALAAPDALASRIATLVQDGLSVQKIAQQIRPLVQDVQTSARRVARTAGLSIAHTAELHVYEQLDDIIEGYRVRAVRDAATRPEHRARDGQCYYRVPVAGQLGFDKMPRPPHEADGTLAFNCRCYLEPLIRSGL